MNRTALEVPGLRRLLAPLVGRQRLIVAARFERHATSLFDRLERLYGDREDFAAWSIDLMETIGRLHAERPPALLALDERRAAEPGWLAAQTMLGYSAYVDRFAGRLEGVAERIPYLQELGVTYLHLLPFLRARAGDNDGGFAVSSHDEVEPRLGTMADLGHLTEKLRAAGISLCADLVLNHVADDHPWARGAAEGNARLRDYFLVFPDRALPDAYERTLDQVFPIAAPGNFTSAETLGWVWTTFYPYQWDLNYANPQVFTECAATLLRLANRGVEVFRLDATAYLWKRLGTDCRNQPEAHWILQALRAIVEIAAPAVALKAEAIVPTRFLPPYLGVGAEAAPECHLAYHSSLMAALWAAVARQDARLLRQVIAETPPLPPGCSWLTYIRCHDDIGWNVLRSDIETFDRDAGSYLQDVAEFFSGARGSFARGAAFQAQGAAAVHGTNGMAAALAGLESAADEAQRAAAVRRLQLLNGVILAFGGLPVIYMGDELALGNDRGAANPPATQDGRWLHRPHLDPALLDMRHDRASPAGAVFADLSRMIAGRRGIEALAANAPRELAPAENRCVLALKRGGNFLLLGNFSDAPVIEPLPDGEWLDHLSGEELRGTARLEAWQSLWLRRAAASDGRPSTSEPAPPACP